MVSEYLQKLLNRELILLDGGMGTLLQKSKLTLDDFQGLEGLNEILCFTRPEVIIDIHLQYLRAGSHAIETNSFGSSRIKLTEYGKGDQTKEFNKKAAELAKEAIALFQKEINNTQKRFVVGTMGPTGKLASSTDPVLGAVTFDELATVFCEQAEGLMAGGAEVLLLETQHDILEVKAGISGCKQAMKNLGITVPIQAQVTVDSRGKMLFGTDILAALSIVQDLGIDVFGINCSTGPDEMTETLKRLSTHAKVPLSVLPNAGIPTNEQGHAHYHLSPESFTKQVISFIENYGVQIIGGCCGTTPEHIHCLAKATQTCSPGRPAERLALPIITSPIELLPIHSPPYIIGERINAQGSKKAKTLMLASDYATLVDMARDQSSHNADLLDICFAVTERSDEKEQMEAFVKQVAYATSCPLVIDSTEPEVIESALKTYAGRALVNSINLETPKLEPLLKIIASNKVATIALCIDQTGMAKTLKQKLDIAQRLYQLAVTEYGLQPEQLIIDPLTFTLATGEEEWRDSSLATFEAIKIIKQDMPGVRTVLGVSNVSFGLTPAARQVLNLVYLHHAVKNGLDFAIYNAAHYFPLSQLNPKDVELAEALIYNKHTLALVDFITHFQDKEPNVPSKKKMNSLLTEGTLEERIRQHILCRQKEGVILLLEEARQHRSPLEIINTILLPAMKVIGERMDKGELILPFVLESAEVMKLAVSYLEPFLDKTESIYKGKIVLATVYGDVHDIGKNLVKTILSNNGYQVLDLGKQVPAEMIIQTAIQEKADAISLSALLVTTSKQMQFIVKSLHDKGEKIPVIIGGAAINEAFAKTISAVDGQPYAGGVFYAKDAFSGLGTLEKLIQRG